MKIKKNKFYEILIGLFFASVPMMPIFTIYGFYFLGILVCFFFILNLLKDNNKTKITSFELFYILLILWNVISLKWSITGEQSVIKWMLIYFVFTVSSIRLSYMKMQNINDVINHFSKWFITGTFLISIVCILYEHPFYAGASRLGTFVFREPYGTRMMYTYNLEISIFILMYHFFKNSVSKIKIKFGIEILFLVICTFLSGTRKIIVGMIIFMLFYMIISNKINIFRILPKLLFIVVALFLGYYLIVNVPAFYNILGSRIESGLSFVNGTGVDASMRDRTAMIDYAMIKFKEHPMIGNGSNTFHYMFYIYYGQDLYAHNTFAELLCDLGIIGFSLYYLIYAFIIFSKYSGKYRILFICSIIALLVMDYWTISYYRIHFLLFYELASLYLITNKKRIRGSSDIT